MARDPADRASVLLLMPVALLVVFLLGAVAIDAAQSFAAQRQAVADAQSVASDAASALDAASVRAGAGDGSGTVDPNEVDRRVAATVALRRIPGTVRWWVAGGSVHVTIDRPVRLVYAAMGHAPGDRHVVGRASARLVVR